MEIKLISKIVVLTFSTVMSIVMSNISSAASVGTGGISTAFSKDSVSLGIVAGSGSFGKEDYLILGVGVGYYLLEGLEVGVDLQHWFFGDPSITKVSPQIRYVFTQPKVIKPYVGAFVRRTFIEDLSDDNSYGYRAGAYFTSKNGVYIGGGVVYEQYQNCSRFVECSNTYPEILISISY